MVTITGKKVKAVKKLNAEVAEATKPKDADRFVSDIEKAIKLGVTIVKTGSHLTVTTYPNGLQELKWDDDALLRDVNLACRGYAPAATEVGGEYEHGKA